MGDASGVEVHATRTSSQQRPVCLQEGLKELTDLIASSEAPSSGVTAGLGVSTRSHVEALADENAKGQYWWRLSQDVPNAVRHVRGHAHRGA